MSAVVAERVVAVAAQRWRNTTLAGADLALFGVEARALLQEEAFEDDLTAALVREANPPRPRVAVVRPPHGGANGRRP